MLEFVLYRSQPRRFISEFQRLEILRQSIENNARDGLSGFLHMPSGAFFQYLEGPPEKLHRRIVKIAADRRHKNFQILAEGDINERLFPDWDMGLLRADQLNPQAHWPGQSHDLQEMPLDPADVLNIFMHHADKFSDFLVEDVTEFGAGAMQAA